MHAHSHRYAHAHARTHRSAHACTHAQIRARTHARTHRSAHARTHAQATTRCGIINKGYDNLETKCRLPVDSSRIPIQLSFPEGTLLGVAKEQLPVEVRAVVSPRARTHTHTHT
jgi:hypothetical protein